MLPDDDIIYMNAVLLDLDGTLIDHFNVIYRCYAYAQKKLGLEQVDFETVKRTVGGSVPVTLERLIGKEKLPEALIHFHEHFDQIFLEDVGIYPGVHWLLHALKERGCKTAVFTNKGGDSSRQLCAHLKFDHYLDAIVGHGDTPYRKPEREFTQYILSRLQSDPDDSCLIGDSPFDIEAAMVVGMASYAVTTGTHSSEPLIEAGAHGVYPDLIELGKTVFGFAAPKDAIEVQTE